MVQDPLNESSLAHDAEVAKNKFQIKIGITFIITHIFCYWPLVTYSFGIFLFMFTSTFVVTVLFELRHQSAGTNSTSNSLWHTASGNNGFETRICYLRDICAFFLN